MDSMIFKEKILNIKLGFYRAVTTLNLYVKHVTATIEKKNVADKILLEKFYAEKEGRDYHDPTIVRGTKVIDVDFTPEMVQTVIDSLHFVNDLTATYPTLSLRMSYVYLIALFDAYLSDVLEEVMLFRPELLRSKKQLTYEKILEIGNFEKLVEYLVKREINELSYKSIRDQTDFYRERFGLVIEESGVSVEQLIELRASRNLFVHGNGIVNHIYLDQVVDSRYVAGDVLIMDIDYFKSSFDKIKMLADYIAEWIITKHVK